MIQFNLLPDVKLEYIRAQRLKRTVMLAATLVIGGSVAVLIILFLVVNVWQHQRLKSLNKSITENVTKLQAIPDLGKVLTIQNQLNSLPDLHNSKPVTSRLFGYLTQLTPQQASISQVTLDFDTNTLAIEGSADSLATVNKYVDTIKFTEFTVGDGTDKKKAFSGVVLNSFAKTDTSATYTWTAQFDKTIFDSTTDVKLAVPDIISTRSETEKPTDLFQKPATNDTKAKP